MICFLFQLLHVRQLACRRNAAAAATNATFLSFLSCPLVGGSSSSLCILLCDFSRFTRLPRDDASGVRDL